VEDNNFLAKDTNVAEESFAKFRDESHHLRFLFYRRLFYNFSKNDATEKMGHDQLINLFLLSKTCESGRKQRKTTLKKQAFFMQK
jgi:hypothetical protein